MAKKTEEIEKKENSKDIIWAIVLSFFVILIWYLSWIYIDTNITTEKLSITDNKISNQEIQGQFGDKFGAINALFSALAFAGIIFTIILQKKELKLQREELEDTREEFVKQNITLNKQRFENTFFQLLKLHGDIVDKLKIKAIDGEIYEKREFFVGAIKDFKYRSTNKFFVFSGLNKLEPDEISIFKSDRLTEHTFFNKLEIDEIKNLRALTNDQIDNFICEPPKNKEIIIAKEYEKFFHTFQYNLGHYFRNLYHIYKYIHITKLIDKPEKNFYVSIVRAQLSTDELVLIFYNCLTPICYYSEEPNLGYPNFKYLIDRYDILQNINPRLLLDKRHMEIFEKNIVSHEPQTFLNISNEI